MIDQEHQSEDESPSAPPPLPEISLREVLRAIRFSNRRDFASQRSGLAQEAKHRPMGFAAWVLAYQLWTRGEIAAAYREAQNVLQGQPTDFDMLRVCLDYHIRARDRAQIYSFSERLIAAKNPARLLRRMHAVVGLILWPLWSLGFPFGRNLSKRADNCDKWVSWARSYLDKHPKEYAAVGDIGADDEP